MKKMKGLVPKSAGRKIAEAFFEEDLDMFKKEFWKKMLKPAIRDFAFSVVQRLLYGGGSRSNYSGGYSSLGSSLVRNIPTQNINYSSRSSIQSAPIAKSKFDFSDLIFESMGAANDLINEMKKVISEQGYVSVVEVYDSLDKLDNIEATDNGWGWYNLNGYRIDSVRSGFLVVLPQPVQLKI